MHFFHLVVLGLGDHVHLGLGSLHLDSMSCFELGDVSLESLVVLVRRHDLVGELLTDDVCDVVALLVTLVQQLKPTATNNVRYISGRQITAYKIMWSMHTVPKGHGNDYSKSCFYDNCNFITCILFKGTYGFILRFFKSIFTMRFVIVFNKRT